MISMVPVVVFPVNTSGISNNPEPLQIPVVGFGTMLLLEIIMVSPLLQYPVTTAPEFKLTPQVRFVQVTADGGIVSTVGTGLLVLLQFPAASQLVVTNGPAVEPVKLGTNTLKFPLPSIVPVPNTFPDPSRIVTVVPASPVPVIGVVIGFIGLGMITVGATGGIVSIMIGVITVPLP